jgi:hypothetical protein
MDSFYANTVQLITLGFLVLALLAAASHAWLTMTAKQQGADAMTKTEAVDPQVVAKIIEALKGLVEALTKAPGWFAIFLAGALLHLMALTLADNANGTDGSQANRSGSGNQSNTANQSRDSGSASGNGQVPANGQAPAGNTQAR